jgi:DNA repair protein RadA
VDLDELPGVGPAIAEKLREAGLNSLEAIAVASPMELVATVEIGEATASKIITADVSQKCFVTIQNIPLAG